jgi:spectinomycin phosphotransferase
MFLDLASERAFADPVAAETARLLRAKRSDLEHCAGRAESLARGLAGQAGRACLCHGDIHAWNILATGRGEFYIVDWDTLVYAPKERDLMFIGAWAGQWDSAREREAFYAGYGPAAIDRAALAYYRYDRIVQDVVAYCEPLLLTDEGGADRAEMYRQLESNFVPGGVLDYARATEQES